MSNSIARAGVPVPPAVLRLGKKDQCRMFFGDCLQVTTENLTNLTLPRREMPRKCFFEVSPKKRIPANGMDTQIKSIGMTN